MPSSEERLLILKMLEEGKITSEEAERLIDALDDSSKQTQSENTTRQRQTNFQDEFAKMRDRMHEWKRDFKNNHSQKDFDRVVEDFSAKAEKLGKNLASTTVGLVDKAIDFVGSFVETNSFNFFGNCPTIDKTYEAIAVEGMELEIEGVNNSIVVKKHLDNKILIISRIRCPARANDGNPDNVLAYSDSGNAVSLKLLNKFANISVSHEVYLPNIRFKKISLQTSNGKIYVEDSVSEAFEAITRNSHIELMGVNSDKISVNTKNARIQVNYVIGKDIDINTKNSLIDIKHIKAEKINAVTMNARILVENVQNYEGSTDMDMSLKTCNASIKVNMDDMDNRGYKVKGRTTNGRINLLIPEIMYHNVSRQGVGGSIAEAESNGFQNYTSKVNINAETTNGYIEVVK
jgi:DUF4097 and DUF4098 domain-containing protein YvlB